MELPPSYILAEAAGLERFAEQMRAEGWDREKVRRLPDVEHGYWYVQSRSMHQLVTMIPFKPGQSILDVGSNTCWAANRFRRARPGRGRAGHRDDRAARASTPPSTSSTTATPTSSASSAPMDSIPLASGSLDYVYCCEVLHHNDPASLRRTFQEIFRACCAPADSC